MWIEVLTLALGIFFGLGAFAALLAGIFAIFDRQEKNRRDRQEVTDLNTRIRTLETENQRLRQQLPFQLQATDEDEEEGHMEALVEQPMLTQESAQEVPGEYVIVRNSRGETREVFMRDNVLRMPRARESPPASEEPRPTRYDRIEDNEPPV